MAASWMEMRFDECELSGDKSTEIRCHEKRCAKSMVAAFVVH